MPPPVRFALSVTVTVTVTVTAAALVGLALGGCRTTSSVPEACARGDRLEADHRYEEARAAYRDGVRTCQRDDRVCRTCRLRAAETLARLHRYSDAVDAYLALRRWTQDPETAGRAAERAAAILADRMDQPRRAVRLCLEVMVSVPAEVAAEDALRLVLRVQTRSNDAAQIQLLMKLHRRLSRTPLADNLLFEAAKIYRRNGDHDRALSLYDQLSANYPRSGLRDDALWRAAQILEARRRWHQALKRYRMLLSTRKDAYLVGSYNSVYLDDAQLRTGVIKWQHLGDPRGAIDALRLLRDDFPDSLLRDDAQWWIAQVHLRSGDRAAACAALRRILKQFPEGNQIRRARRALAEQKCP